MLLCRCAFCLHNSAIHANATNLSASSAPSMHFCDVAQHRIVCRHAFCIPFASLLLPSNMCANPNMGSLFGHAFLQRILLLLFRLCQFIYIFYLNGVRTSLSHFLPHSWTFIRYYSLTYFSMVDIDAARTRARFICFWVEHKFIEFKEWKYDEVAQWDIFSFYFFGDLFDTLPR